MKKLCKALLPVALALALSVAIMPPARADGYFTISNYSYTARVLANNVYEVTETIDADFPDPQHGIYRSIPTAVSTVRESGGKSVERKYRLSVRDVSVDDRPYSVKAADGWLNITIGDEHATVQGSQRYVLHYTLDVGNDYIDDFDEVYLNVIGLGWNAEIDSADFTVELPRPFDASRVGAVAGGAGYENPGQAQWSVEGNTVSGHITKPLMPYEGVTLRVELPQGYFTGLPDPYAADKALLAVILVLGAAGLVLYLLLGRDFKPVRTVEVGPPDGMTPAELGYAWDGRAGEQDMVSMVLYWAGRGNLTIERREKGSFHLYWKKDLPKGAREFEKYLFGQLFRNRTSVSAESLKGSFCDALWGAASMLENAYRRMGGAVYTPKARKLKPWLAVASMLPIMASLALMFQRVMLGWPLALFAAAVMGALGFLPAYWLIRVLDKRKTYRRSVGTVKLACCLGLCVLAAAAFLAYALNAQTLAALPVAAVIVTAALAAFSVLFRRRTKQGRKWLGQALGFRDFIVKAEKDKLLALVEKDPDYFYNILPYAYVLGVTDKWARNFEQLSLRPPEWYSDYDRQFTPAIFARSAMEAMGEFQASMSYAPAGESTGAADSSSGGAVTGGGVGGGGGGAW